jgi:uncharacterized protein (TIGR03437 family)
MPEASCGVKACSRIATRLFVVAALSGGIAAGAVVISGAAGGFIVEPSGTVGQAYSAQVTATGGTSPYRWSAISAPPAGLAFDSTGRLNGIPNAALPKTTYFQVQVTDSSATPQSATTLVGLKVNPAPLLIITTASVPNTVVGLSVSQSLQASGGLAPYTWSIYTTGCLNGTGLSLSSGGLVSGIAQTAGLVDCTVQATDQNASTAFQRLTFQINPNVSISTAPTLPSTPVGKVYSITLSANGGAGGPYAWSVVSGFPPAGLSLTTAGVVQGTPSAAGTSSFMIQASDGISKPALLTATLQVYPALSIPAASLPTATQGVSLTRSLVATGGSGAYSWSVSGNGLTGTGLALSSGGTLSGAPVAAGTITFTTVVADQANNQDSRAFTMQVNPPITVTSATTLPKTVTGQPYTFAFAAQGGSGGTYSWSLAEGSVAPAGLTLSAAGILQGTPTATGTAQFNVVVNDGVSPAGQQSASLLTYPPLTLTTSTLPAAVKGLAVNQTLVAGGGFGTYSWTATGLTGTGLALSAAGALTGTPLAAGLISFTVQVADQANNQKSQTLQLDVKAALAISAATVPNRVIGQPYSFQFATVPGTGSPGATIEWSATLAQLPPGLSLSSSGLLPGTPTSAGQYTFLVTATDGISQPAQLSVTVTIYAVLAIPPVPLPNVTRGQTYNNIALTANGGSGTFSWAATGLPGGISLSSGGVFGGTAGIAGVFSQILVTVTDAASAQTAQRIFSITITAPPLFVSAGSTSIGLAVGQLVNQRFAATGGTPPLTWALSTGQFAPGVSLSADGLVSGSAGAAGNFRATIEVRDGAGAAASASVAMDVLGLATQNNLPRGSLNAFFSFQFAGLGGTPPYSFSGINLPAGLAMAGTGNLSGFPASPGTFGFTVTASDAAGVQASGSYGLTVTNGGALSITSNSAPDAQVNVPYSFALTAVGGSPPYGWLMAGGALPDGLSLNAGGLISGTPSAPGTFVFRVQVSETTGASVNLPFSIRVQASDLHFQTGTLLPAGIVGTDYAPQILSAAGGMAPYTFALTTGSLPAGLGLTNGTISGTPTLANDSGFVLTVTDAMGNSATSSFSIKVAQSNLNLSLSVGSLSFAATSGAGSSLPPSQTVGVQSSQVSQPLNYTVSASPPAPWLSVSGGGTTPGSIGVAVNAAALSLTAGTYQTNLTVTCTSAACAGRTQQVAVTLTVTSPQPRLTVETTLLSFTSNPSSQAAAQPAAQSLVLRNSGGGALGIASVSCPAPWCTAGFSPGSIAGGGSANVSVSVDPSGLTSGFYQTAINIASSGGPASVPVTLFISTSASAELLPSGAQFSAPSGSLPGNAAGSFLISASGNKSQNWSASILSGAEWLSLNTQSGTADPARPAAVSFSIRPAAALLAPQTYYGNIQVSVPGAANSPRNFLVVLNIAPANDPIRPDPQPAGMLFLATPGGALPPQTVQVFASSKDPVAWSASPGATEGGAWLAVSPAVGTTSSATPGASTVIVNPAGLAAGIYRGGVNYALAGSGVRTVNVTLIVQAGTAPTPPQASAALLPHASCSPTALAPTQTGLVNNFSAPTAWPTVLAIKLVNDCGAAVPNGQVVATFSNGDPPLSMNIADSVGGVYSGTWTPRKSSSQVTVQARAKAVGFADATTQIAGAVVPNAAPALNPHGTLHSFAPKVGAALAPGTIAQIYGENLAAQTTVASSIPLPTEIGGTRVLIGGIAAPLYFVSAGQINAQIPFDLDPSRQYQILVQANGALTTPDTIQLSTAVPGLAAFPDGRLIAQHQDGALVTPAAPAKPGEFIVAYLAGMGGTDNPVLSGASSPADPLARPSALPTLQLDGKPVPVLFAGLTPGLVGLYQLNFQIPAGVPAGNLKLVVTQNDSASNITVLPVQP